MVFVLLNLLYNAMNIKINTKVSTHISDTNIEYAIWDDSYIIRIYDEGIITTFEYRKKKFVESYEYLNGEVGFTKPFFSRAQSSSEKTPTKNKITDMYTEILKSSDNVLYYTGAGISRRSGILTMPELEEKLYIKSTDKLTSLLKLNPEYPIKIINDFKDSIKKSRPNIDHFLLRNIIKRFGGQLATENVDYLHELSGIKPIKPLRGEKIPTGKFKTIVLLGTCTMQCYELLNDLSKCANNTYLISYECLRNNKIDYIFYKMDIHDFLTGLDYFLMINHQ